MYRESRHSAARPIAYEGFTLVELLIVIAIIAGLIGLLVPVVSRARDQGRLLRCISNLRGQTAALLNYTTDFDGSLPPRLVYDYSHVSGRLVNEFLANYEHAEFAPDSGSHFRLPTGIWRCPDVVSDRERASHSGVIHQIPNRWLFSTLVTTDGEEWIISNDAPDGWGDAFGGPEWRNVARITRPVETIGFIDNTYYFFGAHGHWDARESVGFGWEVVNDPPDTDPAETLASHMSLKKRPAGYLDGHADVEPAERAAWMDHTTRYHPRGDESQVRELYRRDVQRLMWFIGSGECAESE